MSRLYITYSQNTHRTGKVRFVDRYMGIFRRSRLVMQLEWKREVTRAEAPIMRPEAHTWTTQTYWTDAEPMDLARPEYRWIIDGPASPTAHSE